MRAVTIHGPGDIRVCEVPDPILQTPEDVIVRVTHACICGSDLWAYRGVVDRQPGQRIGHEFLGTVEEVGRAVHTLRPGDRVIAPFVWSDGSCHQCAAGLQTSCPQMGFWGQPGADGGQGEAVRVPFADATLVRVPAEVPGDVLDALVTLADVMSTGHHAARLAAVGPGSRVAIVGDGAVGLCAVIAALRLGAERVVLVGHHEARTELARTFGATDTVTGDSVSGPAAARAISDDRGYPSVVEAVGTAEAMRTAISLTADGGTVGFVGVPHGSETGLDIQQLFYRNIAARGGITPARAYIPLLMNDVIAGALNPAPIFDLTVGLDGVPGGYAAMDSRRALKVLLRM